MQIACTKSIYRPKTNTVLFIAGHTYDVAILPTNIVAYNEQDERHILFYMNHPKGWEWFQEHFE